MTPYAHKGPILTRAHTVDITPAPHYDRAPATFNLFESLILHFDWETTADIRQRGLFCVYRLSLGPRLLEEGVAFPDDLAENDKKIIRDWASERGLRVRPFKNFYFKIVREVMRAGGLFVAYNAPFDVATLFPIWKPASKRMKRERFVGGFVFGLEWKGRDGKSKAIYPLAVRKLGPHTSLFGVDSGRPARPDEPRRQRAQVVDLHTSTWALTQRSMTLGKAAEYYGTEHRKTSVKEFGRVTHEALDYCRNDVLVTEELFWKVASDYGSHPISVHLAKIYSPAAVGKGYLRVMGILHPPALADEFQAAAFSAYYGGWVEASIVRWIVPVVKTDIVSQYPSIICLADLWPRMCASELIPVEATEEVRAFVAAASYETMLNPAAWKGLCTIVLVRPRGELLPTRALYRWNKGEPNIGVNHLFSPEPIWCGLGEVLAAKLRGGHAPEILRAVRFDAGAPQPDLRPVMLRGRVLCDPRTDNFYRLCIEERIRCREDETLDPKEREALSDFLKTLASSTGYGIAAQTDRDDSNGFEPAYREELRAWRGAIKLEADRIFDDRRAATQVFWDALEDVGGKIVPDLVFDPKKKRWTLRGEFADVPAWLLGRNAKRSANGAVEGNLDRITAGVRARLGDDEVSTSDVLEVLCTPRFTYADARAEALEQVGQKPDVPTTLVRVLGRAIYESECIYPERPGEFFCAPIATTITSSAKLLLTMIQVGVERRGGTVAYKDTDSAFIVSTKNGGLVRCPGGPLRMPDGSEAIWALSWAEVDEVRRDIAKLVPYNTELVPDLVKLEDENFVPDADGKRTDIPQQLYMYTLAEKRYAVFNQREGDVAIRDCREHGIGSYLDPTGVKRDGKRTRPWIEDAWERAIKNELEGLPEYETFEGELPSWYDRPAVQRLVFSTTAISEVFEEQQLGAKIAPFRFMLSCSATSRSLLVGPGTSARPTPPEPSSTRFVAPFEKDPARWTDLSWSDLHSRHSYDEREYELATIRKKAQHWLGRACVAKLCTPDGQKPTVETRGLLVPMIVRATEIQQTGKETLFADGPEDESEIDASSADGAVAELLGEKASLVNQRFVPHDPDAELDELIAAIVAIGIKRVASEAKVSRRNLQMIVQRKRVPQMTTQRDLWAAVHSLAERVP